MDPGRDVKIVTVDPRPGSRPGDDCSIMTGSSIMDRASFATTPWVFCPTTARIGLPLMIANYPEKFGEAGYLEGRAGVLLYEFSKDPTNYMKPVRSFKGLVVVARCDLQDLHNVDVDAAIGFILPTFYTDVLKKFYHELKDPAERALYKKQQKDQLNAIGFKKEWEKVRAEDAAAGMPCTNLVCPVGSNCSACKKKEGPEGKALLVCGGCKARYYCSVECQKAEWKQHKKTCKEISS